MEFEYFTPWHFSPRRFDLSGTKKEWFYLRQTNLPSGPRFSAGHHSSMQCECECAMTVADFFWGMLFFHSWHKYISVKPIISIETTDICEILVQFCKSKFEGSPTMDSGQMMLFLGWVGIPQAMCVKTIRWSQSMGSISGVVTSTNSVVYAPRGAPAKMDNYSTDVDLILLLKQIEWM